MRLHARHITRLDEMTRAPYVTAGFCKKTTAELVEAGLAVETGRKTAETGRVVWYGKVSITDAGKEALAGCRK